MNQARLQHLVEILQNIPNPIQSFNMRCWADHITEGKTTCCVLGYAALDPEFRAQGLQFRLKYSGRIISDIKRAVLEGEKPEPSFGKSYGYFAAEAFFELDEITARFIFSPYGYRKNFNGEPPISVQEVIKHINIELAKPMRGI